ncbi:MAG: helix-turn-helix domain-containing protein, partial [Clostridia bacterium]|nr:helix-turn-helix domain-containing protein [Clostridia bacterium]
LSQIQLSRELHVSQSAISSWENGLSEPSLFKLVNVAKFFGVTIDYLIGLKD